MQLCGGVLQDIHRRSGFLTSLVSRFFHEQLVLTPMPGKMAASPYREGVGQGQTLLTLKGVIDARRDGFPNPILRRDVGIHCRLQGLGSPACRTDMSLLSHPPLFFHVGGTHFALPTGYCVEGANEHY